MRGKYFAFSGLDGSGKTTQALLFAEYLQKTGKEVVVTKEPGSDLNGFRVRDILLSHTKLDPIALELLFEADRAEHTAKILDLLEQGCWVVSDRCYLCGVAYALANNHDIQFLSQVMRWAIKVKPDLAFYIDVSPIKAVARKLQRGDEPTREEVKGMGFVEKVAHHYRQVPNLPAALAVPKWKIIDGDDTVASIHEKVVRTARAILGGVDGTTSQSDSHHSPEA